MAKTNGLTVCFLALLTAAAACKTPRADSETLATTQASAVGPLESANPWSTIPTMRIAAGSTIAVVCIYGSNDHDDVTRKKCKEVLGYCQEAYPGYIVNGHRRPVCRPMMNPDSRKLKDLKDHGMIVLIAHSTPTSQSPDPVKSPTSKYDLWDTVVTPEQVSAAAGSAPVIWHGCHGAGIARGLKNIISLQSDPDLIDAADPAIYCRLKATTSCAETFATTQASFSQRAMSDCVISRMTSMIGTDRACMASGISVPPY